MNNSELSKAMSQLAEAVQAVVTVAPKLLDDAIDRVIERSKVDKENETERQQLPRGIVVSNAERTKAAELRDAYLSGKLPEDGSLLIGKKEVSELLNISARTLSRLVDEKAMPNPIRLGNKVQWRIREIVEWVEADCPPQRHWNYFEGRGTNTRKRKGGR